MDSRADVSRRPTTPVRAELQDASGVAPARAIESFPDLEADVRQSVRRVRRSLFLLHRDIVRGYAHDVVTHLIREIEVDADDGRGGG